MVKIKVKSGEVSIESIIYTIEITKKLKKEGTLFVHPYSSGATVGVNESAQLAIGDKEEQDAKTFSENIGIINHIAFHILSGNEEKIDKKINPEIIDAVRNKYIDETFREKFYVGTTSDSHLFTDVDYNVSKKVTLSDKAIVPPVPYLTIWVNLIEALTGEHKKIPIDMDFSTFRALIKQLNEISDATKNFEK